MDKTDHCLSLRYLGGKQTNKWRNDFVALHSFSIHLREQYSDHADFNDLPSISVLWAVPGHHMTHLGNCCTDKWAGIWNCQESLYNFTMRDQLGNSDSLSALFLVLFCCIPLVCASYCLPTLQGVYESWLIFYTSEWLFIRRQLPKPWSCGFTDIASCSEQWQQHDELNFKHWLLLFYFVELFKSVRTVRMSLSSVVSFLLYEALQSQSCGMYHPVNKENFS